MRSVALLSLAVLVVACKKEPAAAADAAPLLGEAAVAVSQQDVKRIVRDAKPGMEKCYDAAVTASPNFGGKVTLVFAVNPDGTVDKKRLGLGGDPGGDAFAKCVLDIVVGLKFPTATAATDVQMPLDLGKHADAGGASDAGPTTADARAD